MEELKRISKGDEILEKVVKDIIDYSQDDRVIDEYRQAIDDANLLFNSKLEGKEEGKLEGYESGKMDGEIKKQQEIARNMLKKGMDITLISEITGLKISEIEILQD